MNISELLKFIPLIIGVFLAYHLIFKLQLPSKSIGAIVTYFVGILVVLFALGWIIASFLPNFANNLLDLGRDDNSRWGEFIDNSEAVVEDAFPGISDNSITSPDDNQGGTTTTQQPVTPVNPPTNTVITGEGSGTENAGRRVHVVVAGDTLNSLSRAYNVSVENIRIANGIPAYSDLIQVGQELIIPAQ